MSGAREVESWTIGPIASVSVLVGEAVELSVAVTSNDIGPDPRRGSLRVTVTPPTPLEWFAVGLPHLSFEPGATERFPVTISIPADAAPGGYRFACFVVVTDDPSNDTTVHHPAVDLQVVAPVAWSVTGDPAGLVLEAGKSAGTSFRVTGPAGHPAELRVDAAPEQAGWFAVDRPSRVLGAATEQFAVAVTPPADWPGGFGGRFTGVVSRPPAPEQRAVSEPVGFCGTTLPVGGSPFYVAVTPDGRRAYVSNPGSDFVAGIVTVLDTASGTVTGTVSVPGSPRGIGISPDGSRAYVSDIATSNLWVIDTASDAVVQTIPIEGAAMGVAVSPDGRHVYATSGDSDAVSVVDTVAGAMIAAVRIGGFGPRAVAVSPDGKRVYATVGGSSTIAVIDPVAAVVTAHILVGDSPVGVAVSPDGTRVYVASEADEVSIIDTVSGAVATTITVEGPIYVAVSPDGRRAYVVNHAAGSVTVIDTEFRVVTGTVPVGSDPFSLAVSPDGRRIYVANLSSGTVSVLDATMLA